MKLNLIYNSEARNNGTPVYFWHAMKELGLDFNRFLPRGTMPDADFTIWIDDGMDSIKWLPKGPWGYYATDSHLGHDYRRWKSEQADIVWCAQKPFADELKRDGINAHWVPLAANPVAHPTIGELAEREDGPTRLPKYDWGFVGHLQSPKMSNRVAFLDDLCSSNKNFRLAFGVFHEDMARVYHQCRIGVNHAVRDDLNMRFFELASCGVPQLCDRRMVGLSELGYQEGLHYIGYASKEEAVENISKALSSNAFNLSIMAKAALTRVRTFDCYTNRVQFMLRTINEFHSNSSRSENATERGVGQLLG